MKTTIWMAVAVAALVAMSVLTGCPKKAQTELQGAPTASQPPAGTATMPGGTHMMPGGTQMPGAMMPQEGKPGVEKTAASDMASCPVLGTTMAKKDMTPYEYKGKTYYLCCRECVTKFKANPEKYIKHPAKPLPPGAPMPSG